MAVVMPTNYGIVQCVKVLIDHCVDSNAKASVILTITFVYYYLTTNCILFDFVFSHC